MSPAPPDSFTVRLHDELKPEWQAATDHTFVQQLRAGTLDEEVFRRYLQQDYIFIDALAGLVGFAIGEAPSMSAKTHLTQFLAVLTANENDYFERAFDALSAPDRTTPDPEPNATTATFQDLLHRAAREGYPEALSVLVPAEWIYLTWASTTDAQPDQFYFAEWIDLHSNPEFADFVTWLRDELDAQSAEIAPSRRKRLERHFTRTVELEAAFFDAAFTE